MKTLPLNHHGARGNTLMLTLFATAIVGFILAAYLTLVKSQNQNVSRSQAWNATVAVIEAGIEDGLTHLNIHGTTNLLCDGWRWINGQYVMQRTVGDNYYQVAITNWVAGSSNNVPIINSYGFVQMPVLVASAQNALFAAAGVYESGGKAYLARGVRATTRKDMLFVKGLVAKETIDLNGNNVRTDSFDSTDPFLSTNGRYDVAKWRDNGDIAVNGSVVNSINIGNANIYGHASTGPNGTIAVGAQGTIGSKAWQQAGGSGIQPNWTASDMNMDFPDMPVPFGGGFPPGGGAVTSTNYSYGSANANSTTYPNPPPATGVTTNNGTVTQATYPSPTPAGPVTTNTTFTSSLTYPAAGTFLGSVATRVVSSGPDSGRGTWYDYNRIVGYSWQSISYTYQTITTNATTTTATYNYILDDGDYQLPNLSGTVCVRGNARLYVPGSCSLSGITIQDGRHLSLYNGTATGSQSVSLAGNNTANSDGTADSFSFYGLPSVTSVTLSGNAGYTGTIYAPNASFTMNGGGNNTLDCIGAAIVKKVTMNGHFNFHYDEALGRIGPCRGFVVTGWTELRPTELQTFTWSAQTVNGGN